jgi:KDO2-lipid IV(A) lauroyltransferase
VARASFRHFGREFLASFLLGGMSQEEVLDRTEFVGFEPFQEAAERGEGIVLVTAHFGNWELAGAALASRGVPLDVVAQRQRNPLFHTELTRSRTELGMRVILRGDALREGLRSLRKGRVLALLGDQNLRRGGVFVDFLGKKASTARGAAVLALRVGCPMFFGLNRRLPGYPPRYRVEIVPVEVSPTGDLEGDAIRLTEVHTRLLEEQVRLTPEQYFWQHRRWKTRPSDEEPRE